ncbi:MAG: hypothetical protein MJK08_03990 [Campylobacterales bacterium]|nr:hypothetical protein [Campylobacterales bacterium]
MENITLKIKNNYYFNDNDKEFKTTILHLSKSDILKYIKLSQESKDEVRIESGNFFITRDNNEICIRYDNPTPELFHNIILDTEYSEFIILLKESYENNTDIKVSGG